MGLFHFPVFPLNHLSKYRLWIFPASCSCVVASNLIFFLAFLEVVCLKEKRWQRWVYSAAPQKQNILNICREIGKYECSTARAEIGSRLWGISVVAPADESCSESRQEEEERATQSARRLMLADLYLSAGLQIRSDKDLMFLSCGPNSTVKPSAVAEVTYAWLIYSKNPSADWWKVYRKFFKCKGSKCVTSNKCVKVLLHIFTSGGFCRWAARARAHLFLLSNGSGSNVSACLWMEPMQTSLF